MRILLAPHGTRGDVQPLLPLARALRAHGHNIRFIAPANSVASIRERGFACESNGIDVEAMLRAPDADLESFRWQMRHFSDVLIPRLFDSVARAAGGAELLVGSGVQMAAASVAESIGARYLGVAFCPCAIPNDDIAPPTVRSHTLPPWINRMLWRVGLPITDAFLRGPINRERARLGLPPSRSPLRLLLGAGVILAADRELAPPGRSLVPAAQTDAWVLDDQTELDPRVDAFLRAGPAPVYVGFGSMIAKKVRDLGDHVVRAARLVGCRLIVAGGWAALDSGLADSDQVLTVSEAPHDALLPRVAAAVHHGGAGTTTAAARAGVPQVIVPHILDQFYWAQRVEALTLGPSALPVRRVTADALASRLAAVLTDWRFRDRAREVGPRVASRNGVPAAVDHLERLVGA